MKEAKKTLETRINFCAQAEDFLEAQPKDIHELPEDSLDSGEEATRNRSKRTQITRSDECDSDPLLNVEAKLKKESTSFSTEDLEDEDIDGRTIPRSNPRKRKTYNVDAENLDFNVTFVKTKMQRDQLIHGTYTYNLVDFIPPRDDVTNWKCSLKQKRRCHGRVVTALNNTCILRDTMKAHNHRPKTEETVLVIRFKNEVNQIVRNHPDMKTSEIIASAKMLLGSDLPRLLTVSTISRLIQRWRTKLKKKAEKWQPEDRTRTVSDEGEIDFM